MGREVVGKNTSEKMNHDPNGGCYQHSLSFKLTVLLYKLLMRNEWIQSCDA